MMDPSRPTVPDAVYKCHCAGIKVMMVTNDHPDTVKAIAKYVGIITEHDDNDVPNNDSKKRHIVVTSSQLRDLLPEQLDQLIRRY